MVVSRLRAAGCVFAEDEARLLIDAAPNPAVLAGMVERRVEGLPLEHVIGWADFCGVRVAVDPGVFVPRHRSALLVDQAVARAPVGGVVVDLCCGAGALGAAIAARVALAELHAVDIDPAAVECARRNLRRRGQRVYLGDLFTPLPAELRGRVDVVVVNAPYVPTAEVELLPREARLYETRVALDGGEDGLDVHRAVAVEAPAWLVAGGHLLTETSADQAARATDLFRAAGLVATVERDDDLEATVVVGRAAPA